MKPRRGHRKREDGKREVPVREEGQTYARVTKMLGNGMLLATCVEGVERLCKIRGSMWRREWVHPGDVVLVALRDFQDTKADVVFKYQDHEVQYLKRMGEEVAFEAADDDDTQEYVQFEGGDGDDDVDVDAV